MIDGVEFKLSLLPSGIVRSGKIFIGNGVVVDPKALLAEIETLRGCQLTQKALLLQRKF